MSRRLFLLGIWLTCISGAARAGAWPQPAGEGFALTATGYALRAGETPRLTFNGYGEAGLGGDLTAVFLFDGDLDLAATDYVWRAGAGLRTTFALDEEHTWLVSVEGTVRYQDHAALIPDPVFAGDGWGGGVRADAGHAFLLMGRHAFADLGVSYTYRSLAPAETRVEIAAGLDLTVHWQAGLGLASTFAPGAFYEPGAYEKHEAEIWLRWRLDDAYALSISVMQTLAAERAAQETVIRLGVWTFIREGDAE